MNGAHRQGAGRPPSPRLTIRESSALLDKLRGSGTDALLADRLGVTKQAVSEVRNHGMTVAQAASWKARINAAESNG